MEWQKCPVCNGTGQVPHDFYWAHPRRDSTMAEDKMETCQTCEGRGIVVRPFIERT